MDQFQNFFDTCLEILLVLFDCLNKAVPQPQSAQRAVPQPIQTSNEIFKTSTEGGGCVNTQTGSGRVAASQSNNVNCATNVRNESMKNVYPTCMNVKNVPECANDALPETKIVSDKTWREDPHSVSKVEDRPKFKAKYRVNNSSGGKFNLTSTNESPVSPRNSANNRKSSSVQSGLEYFRKLENIIINLPKSSQTSHITQGKRKFVTDNKGARTPASISTKMNSRSARDIFGESPAKKQRGSNHTGGPN